MRPWTGLMVHPHREQPYTVWLHGSVVGFDATLEGAEHRYCTSRLQNKPSEHRWPPRHQVCRCKGRGDHD